MHLCIQKIYQGANTGWYCHLSLYPTACCIKLYSLFMQLQ